MGWQQVQHRLLLAGFLLMLGCGLVGLNGLAVAQSASVSVGVGDTNLRVTGKTAPGAMVTVLLDESIIGTGAANAQGEINLLFMAMNPGLHMLVVWSKDVAGRDSSPVSQPLNLAKHSETTAVVFLPPTFEINPTQATPPQPIMLQGAGYPLSSVYIIVNDSELVATTVDNGGDWSVRLGTAGLQPGLYDVYVKAGTSLGEQSHSSAKQTFRVLTDNSSSAVRPGGMASMIPLTFAKPGDVTPIIVAPRQEQDSARPNQAPDFLGRLDSGSVYKNALVLFSFGWGLSVVIFVALVIRRRYLVMK